MAKRFGNGLRVNLTTRSISSWEIEDKIVDDYIGSRGVAAKIFYDEVNPQVDPFSAENKIIIACGPLTGTRGPSCARYTVTTKSPLTGAIACSNSGGFFPAFLRRTGYDIVVFEGQAETPVYLLIEDGRAELRNASHLWGKTTHETDDALRAELGSEVKISCIGPAGEKLSRIAAVINDKNRAAARSGVGAVMGAKKLKAIVVRGQKEVPAAADPDKFQEAVNIFREKLKESPFTSEGLPTYGTAMLVSLINESGLFPTRNFKEAIFEGADKIGGEAIKDKILVSKKSCYGCAIACGRHTRITAGPFLGEGEGPEYETTWAFGGMCGVDNLEAITKANYLCNELGMDTIDAGVAIACAMELAERGFVSEAELGRKLRFGDAQAIVDLTEQMGRRQGFGDVLAEGGYRMAEKYGHPELFMGVKKQAFPAYDPRGSQGMGVQYATSNRGACHVRGYVLAVELFGTPEKRPLEGTEDKAFFDIAFQNTSAVVDAAGLCLFTTFGATAEEVRQLLNTYCGWDMSLEEMLLKGDRIWNIERLFNLCAGFTSADDTLPPRILTEAIPAGPLKGQVNRLAEMLPEYYHLRGWDAQGRPTESKLATLGLK